MKVIGFRKSSFKGDDGQEVSGVNLFLTEKCEKGEGLSCDRIYVMDRILAASGYTPKLGDEVIIEWNRWGKCDVTRSVSKTTEIERRGGKRWDKPKKAEKSRDCGGGKF